MTNIISEVVEAQAVSSAIQARNVQDNNLQRLLAQDPPTRSQRFDPTPLEIIENHLNSDKGFNSLKYKIQGAWIMSGKFVYFHTVEELDKHDQLRPYAVAYRAIAAGDEGVGGIDHDRMVLLFLDPALGHGVGGWLCQRPNACTAKLALPSTLVVDAEWKNSYKDWAAKKNR